MAPQTRTSSKASTSSDDDNNPKSNKQDTVVIETDPKDGTPPFVRCNSSLPFVNPTVTENKTAKEVNQELNLNLGLSIDPNNSTLRNTLRFFNLIFVSWWEDLFFWAWNAIPLGVKKRIVFFAWEWYSWAHAKLLGRCTAIHPDASEEYHALTSIMWWGRLFPVTIKRMRFSLAQLTVWTKPPILSDMERIDEIVPLENVPDQQVGHCRVRGIYIHTQKEEKHTTTTTDERVIFWLYGGAFLSGDVDGNTGPAESVGRACGRNVFLPTYRLLPECTFDDMLWDVALAYTWLVRVRKVDPSNIVLFGISSGSGLAVRLLQFVAELKRGETLEPPYITPLLQLQSSSSSSSSCEKTINMPPPAGAVLMCPFVDYTEPKGTFKEFDQHDLIVNQSVTEIGFPLLEQILGSDDNRRRTSPVHRNLEGLPPLCVVVSEHEVVYDQTILLVNRARMQNVQITLGVWKFMCHVFCFLSSFVPEGKQSMDFCCEWIKTLDEKKE